MLRGLKKYTKNLTAVVTVADDGGGSGVLRRDIGMPPPGISATAWSPWPTWSRSWSGCSPTAFRRGSLAGQSFGNLILAALNGVTGSFEEAVAQMSQVLAITGRILPVTSADVQLEAVFENGARVVGESKISSFKKSRTAASPMWHCSRSGPRPPGRPPGHSGGGPDPDGTGQPVHQRHPQPAGGGGVVEAICRSEALKIYVCNIMTQEGGDRGVHRRRPCGRPAVPRGAGAGGPVPGQLGAGASRPGGEVPEEDAAPSWWTGSASGPWGGGGRGGGGVGGGGGYPPPNPGRAGGGGAGRVPPAGGAHLPGRTAVHH